MSARRRGRATKSRLTSSTGLVRFIPSSDPSKILIGQPIQHEIDVGKALRDGKQVDVSIFSGTSVLEPGSDTGNVESIQRILSPLAQNEVGTIRCIGLNVRLDLRAVAI